MTAGTESAPFTIVDVRGMHRALQVVVKTDSGDVCIDVLKHSQCDDAGDMLVTVQGSSYRGYGLEEVTRDGEPHTAIVTVRREALR